MPISGIDFVVDSGFQLDLTAVVQAAQLAHPVQAMFIDASLIPYGNTTIQIFGTGQRIVFPPLCQGYVPILCTQNSFVFTFTNGSNKSGNVSTAPMPVFFINVPFVTQIWSTSGGGGYGIGPLGGNPLGS